jgi:hypothetical protein
LKPITGAPPRRAILAASAPGGMAPSITPAITPVSRLRRRRSTISPKLGVVIGLLIRLSS